MKENNLILQTVILERDYDDGKCTLGKMYFDQTTIHTLELPWKDNKQGESCIPVGEYIVKKTVSPSWTNSERIRVKNNNPSITKEELEKIKVELWEVLSVPGRTGIRIHSANFTSQLRGCIAPGLGRHDINKDGTIDVVDSKKALSLMEDELPREFKLVIRWIGK